MPSGGPRPGAGRPTIEISEEEEWAIAAAFFQRMADEVTLRQQGKINENLSHASTHYEAMREAHSELCQLYKPGTKKQTVTFRERFDDAKAERKMFLKELRKNGRVAIPEPRRPQGQKERIAKEVAQDLTKLWEKKISKTRVLDCWKKHSAMFLDPARTDPDV
jgi:hypothetical protein